MLAALQGEVGVKARRDGHRDGMRSAWIGMQVALQMPAGIEFNPHISDPGLVENSPPEHPLGRPLRSELGVYDEEYRVALTRQGSG